MKVTNKIKTIGILCGPKNANGPTTWKNGLVEQLTAEGVTVHEIEDNVFDLFRNILLISKLTVIHGYCLTVSSMALIILSFILNKKIIFTLHGNYFTEIKSKSGFKKILFVPMYSLILKLSSVVTFPSSFLKENILAKINIKNKSVVIPNGLSIKKIFNAITINRLNWNKKRIFKFLEVTGFNYHEKAMGIVPLIKAVNKYNYGHLNKIELTVLGNGKYFSEFLHLNSKYVKLLGYVSKTDMYISKSDVCIHSTYLDNMPYSIIEAMSYSKPIIATRTGGIPEMVDSRCLCDPNAESIYKKLCVFIDNVDYVQKSILSNRSKIKKLNWTNIVGKFIKLYEQE